MSQRKLMFQSLKERAGIAQYKRGNWYFIVSITNWHRTVTARKLIFHSVSERAGITHCRGSEQPFNPIGLWRCCMIYCSRLPSLNFVHLSFYGLLREPALLFFARKGKHLILWVRWKRLFIVTQNLLRIAVSKESTRLGAFLYMKTGAKPASETLSCFKFGRWTKSGERSSLQWRSWYMIVSRSKFSSVCVGEKDAIRVSLRDSWHKLQRCFFFCFAFGVLSICV